MKLLREKQGYPATHRALRFLSIRLRSRPATAVFEPPIAAARASLVATNEAWEEAVEARVAATAEVEYLATLLDAAVGDCAREAQVLVRNDRKDPRFQKLFSVAPTVAMRPTAGEAQDRFVQNIIQRLMEDADLATLRPHADKLAQCREALKTAVERRNALYVPEAKAAADRSLALDTARRLYNQMPAQLTLALGADRVLIDSFFVDFARGGSEDEGNPTEG